MSQKEGIYRIELIISEYNSNDEGFYTIRNELETAKGKEQLTESFNFISKNFYSYLKRRLGF